MVQAVDTRVIVPDDRGAFMERALAIKKSLEETGMNAAIDMYRITDLFSGHVMQNCEPYHHKKGIIREANINIYIDGYNVIPNPEKTNICIQTEHLSDGIFKEFIGRIDCWDLVLETLPYNSFKYEGILNHEKMRIFCMGYSEFFDTDYRADPDGRLFFFGTMTPHRETLAKEYNIRTKNVYGIERDRMIKRSMAVINMNYCPALLFSYPPFRGLLAFCKGRALLQERCLGGYGVYGEYVIEWNQKNFSEILELWPKEKLLEHGQNVKNHLMRNHRFEDEFRECTRGILQ